MKNLTLSQISFFNHLIKSSFKNNILKLHNIMGQDEAFYYCLGEEQTKTKNYSFDDLSDEQQDDFIEALFIELQEIEF